MSAKKCILLLGSNIGDKNNMLDNATACINKQVGKVVETSNRIETEPIGFESDQWVLNQKIAVLTNLSPIQLLNAIKLIEKKLGRQARQPKTGELFADREIDIDILFYENINFKSRRLNIPHQQVWERDFIKELKFF